MTHMIAAVVLSLLLLCSFSFMMLKRRQILSAPAVTIQNLEAFDEIVATAIRDAGSDERRLREMSCSLHLSDLRKISRNSRVLMERAGELREKTWGQVAHGLAGIPAPDSEDISYVTDLHRGLLRVNSSRAKEMFFSAIEIILGKMVHHTHYHYTYSVEAAYCTEADIVETMADIVDEPTARFLRTHLS